MEVKQNICKRDSITQDEKRQPKKDASATLQGKKPHSLLHTEAPQTNSIWETLTANIEVTHVRIQDTEATDTGENYISRGRYEPNQLIYKKCSNCTKNEEAENQTFSPTKLLPKLPVKKSPPEIDFTRQINYYTKKTPKPRKKRRIRELYIFANEVTSKVAIRKSRHRK